MTALFFETTSEMESMLNVLNTVCKRVAPTIHKEKMSDKKM